MAVISYGEHTHPPPPPNKIPQLIKDEIVRAVKAYGVAEATARRLQQSPILNIILNGKIMSETHISLTNLDAVNHLIKKERLKEFPGGTDYLGALHLMSYPLGDGYIRSALQNDDGHFVILCQLREQSQLFFQSYELQVDKTFSRTRCREFEFNSFDHATKRSTTLARVFTDYEHARGYEEAFRLVFKTAESDIGRRIPWGHLISEKQSICRIKAILVDEHGGQFRGLANYFANDADYKKKDGDWHILRIVKICQVHYERSINKLKKRDVNEGIIIIFFY
jgi:hypothetical protein